VDAWRRLGASGEDALRSARQAAGLFLLSGLLAVLAIPTAPDKVGVLLLITAGDLAVALAARVLPWQRWGVEKTALLAVPGCLVMAVSTWAFGGFAAGTGPFFVLFFVWLGLHQTDRVILAVAPVAAIAYAGGLAAAGANQRLLGTTGVLVPVIVAVGLIISNRVSRLGEARDVIAQQDRWRAALAATLAHDVRTPLTTIGGTLELLADDEGLPEHLRPLLVSASRQTARIGELSSNLLDSERIDQGRLRLDVEDVDVLDTARRVVELVGAAEVRVDVPPGLRVKADRMRLEQMLVNLANNAVRHGGPGITIAARRLDHHVELSVRDDGPGVPPADQEHLFERLSANDRNPGSVGLGLWIVKELAHAHGGAVAYHPVPTGAEFAISLPA